MVINSDEFQTQALARYYVAYHSACANLSLRREEVELYRSTDVCLNGGFDKHATEAEVSNSREFLSAAATPESVYAFPCLKPRGMPAVTGHSLEHG